MAYTKYSLTPADNNAAPPNGAPEGMLPSAVNDTMRDMMSQIRDVGDGIRDGTYTMTAPVIIGGSINGTTVGATTRSTGAFTTLASNGATTFTAGTASTSTTTGTAVITGGLGVSGRINAANFDGIVGANTAAAGNFTTLGASGVATFSAGTVSAPAITTTGDTNTGIFFPAADTIAFAEGGTEVARFDSAGNLGVGTTSPTAKLQVSGSGYTSTRIASSTDEANLYFAGTYGQINCLAGDMYITTDTASNIICRTNGTERMRILSNGKVAIGSNGTGNGVALSVDGSSASDALMNFRDTRGDGASGVPMCYFQRTSGTVGSINTTTSSTSYNTSSDYRLKENIAPMTGALATVSALKPVTYKWKVDGSDGQGFIAHELQEVVPDCVQGEKDAVDADGNPIHQGIDTSFLVATLTAAIQELKATVDAQAARIAALEGAAV
jgi:hypothetical protein